jgi:hypothetical protein
MAMLRKCPKCAQDIADPSVINCPACGAPIFPSSLFPSRRVGPWIAATIQIAITTIFMLLFRFPKIMILIFVVVILIGTAFSVWIKPRQAAARTLPSRPVSNPVLLKIIGFFIALSSLICVALVIFGFVIFMNAWTRWHQYEGQPYHRADFRVKHVSFQRRAKGGTDASASGMVEDKLEYINLLPYVRPTPRSEAELNSRVPVGTVIRIYLFPNLKGQARVQVYDPVPPAEASHRMAVSTVKNTLLALAVMAIALFVLSRLRELCFAENEPSLQHIGTS